jgi:hypothetical protein
MVSKLYTNDDLQSMIFFPNKLEIRWRPLQDFFFNKGPYGKIKKSFFLETTNIRIMIRWAKKGFCELLVLI